MSIAGEPKPWSTCASRPVCARQNADPHRPSRGFELTKWPRWLDIWLVGGNCVRGGLQEDGGEIRRASMLALGLARKPRKAEQRRASGHRNEALLAAGRD